MDRRAAPAGEKTMDIMEQCRIWHENDEYKKIIDAIESLPESMRTPEMISELARAYNNYAQIGERRYFLKAIHLLKSVEKDFPEDHCWNFRMGYAYYYLDEEGPALHYFKKALEYRPGDSDTEYFIEDCRRRLTLPRFEKNFRQRAEACWEMFCAEEADLRAHMAMGDEGMRTALDRCGQILKAAFAEVSFGLSCSGAKSELVLTPEGERARLLQLLYFRSRAPQAVLQHWDIRIGRQPSASCTININGQKQIGMGEVQVWMEARGDNPENLRVDLQLYCPGLVPMLHENSSRAWWLVNMMLDQTLGELANMKLVDGFEVLDMPKLAPGFTLDRLPEELKKLGLVLDNAPDGFMNNAFFTYEMTPNQDPRADWRMDVTGGHTCCPVLINEYLHNETEILDAYHRDGIAAGFICFDSTAMEDDGEEARFLRGMESHILAAAGPEAVSFTGSARGLFFGYLDFVAWDLEAVLRACTEYLKDRQPDWAMFHSFRREVSSVRIGSSVQEQEEQPETEPEGPEVYDDAVMELVEKHIARYFGSFDCVLHETVSPDIHVDICLVPPAAERDYYTLVTMGMGAHRMNVPQELAEYRLERAELLICLPSWWKVDEKNDERWYWPIRLLKQMARFPGVSETWLAWGHTVSNGVPYDGSAGFCASLLLSPLDAAKEAQVLKLPDGEEINFYQLIPLYKEELDYKVAHDTEALVQALMPAADGVVEPGRLPVVWKGFPVAENMMDSAEWHLADLRKKKLQTEEIAVYSHMAIYLRWCMEHGLMGEKFNESYGAVAGHALQAGRLREFIRDELRGLLLRCYFNGQGADFAAWYYDNGGSGPFYPADVDSHALAYFGERYYAAEFQDEAYLFVPFDEKYYGEMAAVIDGRWQRWLQEQAAEGGGE